MLFKRKQIKFKNKNVKEKKVKISISMTGGSNDFFQNLITHHKLERSSLIEKLFNDLFSQTDSLENEFTLFYTNFAEFSLYKKNVSNVFYSLDFWITPSNLEKVDNFIWKTRSRIQSEDNFSPIEEYSSRNRSYFFRILFQFFYEKAFSIERQEVLNRISLLLTERGYPIENSGIVSRGKYYFVVKDRLKDSDFISSGKEVDDDKNKKGKGK